MGYGLGIDLGTTYTAGAVYRNGRAEIASLGSRSAAIPSVVLLRADETVLTGEAANRRALTEPERVAREFKRRLGDTTPILVGGAPYSAEALMARLLRWVVDEVRTREGGEPDHIAISHPANWGQYKIDLLRQAVRLANLSAVTLLTEPEAAAIHYAHQERVEPGSIVAVYDLGGGTFDAAILRKTDTGFEILGEPEGIERLGGIDFDAAVFAHVSRALGGRLQELDEDDPSAQAGVARLREECTEAKEALSSDTDVSIPVLLPNIATEVRLTRSEFEAMIRPSLVDSIEAMRRAMRSAGVAPEQVTKVLLVGGSSRMPIVAQLIGAELGRPVAVDAHPKHAIALGAAIAASTGGGRALTGPGTAAPVVTVAPEVPPVTSPPVAPPPVTTPTPPPGVATGQSPAAPAGVAPTTQVPLGPAPRGGEGSKRTLIIAAAAVVVLLAAVGGFLLLGGDDGTDVAGAGTETTQTTVAVTETTGSVEESTTSITGSSSTTTIPEDEACTIDGIRSAAPWACLQPDTVTFDGRFLTAEYEADWNGQTPDAGTGLHLHIFGSDQAVEDSGTPGGGAWVVYDQERIELDIEGPEGFGVILTNRPEKLCIRVADARPNEDDHVHALVREDNGNCMPIEYTDGS